MVGNSFRIPAYHREVCYHPFYSISLLWICLMTCKVASPNLQMMGLYGRLEKHSRIGRRVTTDVKKIQHNCNKWRLKISLGKTEVTLFQAEEKDDNIV